MARTGRRTGDVDTRDQILDAARSAFADSGFRGATIRRIAGDAGVDPALVMHYFGSKADLYAAATALPMQPSVVASAVVTGPREELGLRVATMFMSVWEQPEARAPLLGMLRGAVSGHHDASSVFAEFLDSTIFEPIAEAAGVPKVNVQAGAAQLIGVAFMRYILELEPIASAPVEDIVAMVAPRMQAALEP